MRRVMRVVAVGFLVAGVALVGTGLLMAYEAFVCSGDCFFAAFGVIAGVILLSLGVGHVAAFAGIWRRRAWGSWLGMSMALAGLAINAFLLIGGAKLILDGREITGIWFWPLVAYGIVVLILAADLRGKAPA